MDFFIGLLCFAFSSIMLIIAIYLGAAGFEEYQDSLFCKRETGLYNGCHLKMHEDTINLNVKNK